MTNPNDPHDADFRATLPADLQGLDRELSGIRIEERPSFGPELEGELIQAWQTREMHGSRGPRLWVRPLMAAALAALMIGGLSVPSARAAVFQFVRTVTEGVGDLFTPDPVPNVQLPDIQVQEPALGPPEPRTEVVVSPVDASEEVETSNLELPTFPVVEITFPELLDRQNAGTLIASHYPLELQEAGIQGAVRLEFWVDDQGIPENINLRQSSGDQRLDYAAMRAARDLRFRPSTRDGVPVGTWVSLGVHFYALTGAGIIGLDTTGSGM